MEKLTFSQLRDIHPGLRQKVVETVKYKTLSIKCPACSASLGNYSVHHWINHKNQTCKKCKEKTQLDFSKISSHLRDIEKM